MRLVAGVLLGLAPIVFASRTADDLKFQVDKGTRLEKTFENNMSLELDSLSVKFGDEEISPDELGEIGLEIKSERKFVFVDEYRETGPGRPNALVRTFETLTGTEKQTSSGDGETSEETSDETSTLEGKSVLFQWSDEDDAFKKSYAGDGGDDELLEALVEDSDLRAFLPGKSVSDGDQWSVDAKVFNGLLEPGGDVALESEDEDDDSEVDEQLDQNLSGDVRVTYKGSRDSDGVQVAVLFIEAKLETHSEQTTSEDEETTDEKYLLALEVEGELLWATKLGRPLSFSLEGRATVTVDQSSTMSFGGESFSMTQKMTLSGDTSFKGTWTVAE